MTRPTTSQIDAYCAALKAWGNGEHVQWKHVDDDEWTDWQPGLFRIFNVCDEYRIVPAPPKLREFWVEPKSQADWDTCHDAWTEDGICEANRRECIHVREVSETADAEIAEKLRNHDALCRAIAEFIGIYIVHGGYLMNQIDKHGAILK